MTPRSIVSAAAIACVLVALTIPAYGEKPEKVLLRQAYKPGTYEMTFTSNTDQTIVVGDQPQPPQQVVMTLVTRIDVDGPDAKGLRRMSLSFARIKQEVRVGGGGVSYDSALPAETQNPDLARVLRPLSEAKVEMMLDPEDKVVSVSGLDRLWDEMAKEDPMFRQLAEQLKTTLGDKMLTEMIRSGAQTLPPAPVGVGEKWSSESDVDIPIVGKLRYAINGKVTSIAMEGGNKIAMVDFSGSAKTDAPQETTILGLPGTIRQMEFQQTGKIKFDTTLSMPVGLEMQQTGKIEMTLQEPDQQPTPMKIDQTVKATMSLKYQPKGTTTQKVD